MWCDDLPGCCSQGATRAGALENIDAAINEYLAARADDAAFAAVLAKVPDVEPEPNDRW